MNRSGKVRLVAVVTDAVATLERHAYAGVVKSALVRLAALGLLTSILVIPLGSTASAHAAYKDSDPADESSIARVPAEIWAEYTEPPSQGSYLSVFDPCGEQVDTGDSRPEGYRLYVGVSADRAGMYRVEWFVDSSLDNHPTRGTFTFTVTEGESCPGAARPDADEEPRDRDRPAQRDGSSQPADAAGDRQASDDPAGASGDGGRQTGRHDQHRGRAEKSERNGQSDGGELAATGAPSSFGGPEAPKEPGLLSDIPIGGLVIALSMAAAIGAAGGFIYAGIMGYHRVSG